jgi:SAM-dependent methyltransferase
MEAIDSPDRIAEIRAVIESKPALKRFYLDIYRRYAECLARCPKEGLAVELGSGGGFAQQVIPELITTDILPYEGVDRVVDAIRMPFQSGSVRFFCMLNVFHHIPDVAAFLREAVRCLAPGGRMLVVDQHPGWISKLILRHLHHEPFRPDATEWRFETTGPLSGANGALAWLVFVRDRLKFFDMFPELDLTVYKPFAPLIYWLAGGLKSWCLLPAAAYDVVDEIDRFLLRRSPDFGSFVEIELLRNNS